MASGDVIDADVAEALKQLKRGFRETEQANASPALAPPKPRPPPPPWEPVKIPRTAPSQLPKAVPQLPKFQPQQIPKVSPTVGPSLNLISRSPGGMPGLGGGIPALRSLGGPVPLGGNQFGNASANSGAGGGVGMGSSAGAGPMAGPAPAPGTVSSSGVVAGGSKNQVQLEIPQSSVGLLIGKQATTINAIKVFSRAHCFVDQHSPSEEKARVTIVGQPIEVEKCKRAVEGLLDGSMSTGMIFQLAGLPAPPGLASGPRPPGPAAPPSLLAAPSPPGLRPPGPAASLLAAPSAATGAPAAFAAPTAPAATAPPAPAVPALQPLPTSTPPVLPEKDASMLASTIALSAHNPGMPMDNYLNEYYARCWSQYGHMAGRTAEEPTQEVDNGQTGPQAFDKAALARLAEQAAQAQEDEKRQAELQAAQAAQPPPQLAPEFAGAALSQPGGFVPEEAPAIAHAVPPNQLKGDLAERASTEVRHLLGDLLPTEAPPPVPEPGPVPGLAVPPPAPAPEAPKPQPGMSGFTGFTLQATPQAQKDSASVQKMLQRLQGNMQQTIQAMSVQQVQAPAQPSGQGKSTGLELAVPGSLAAVPEPRGLIDPEWEALEQRVVHARSPEDIEDVGRAVLKKFPSLAPEQLAELLQKMGAIVGRYHGDFLTELSRTLATRLKELSSTQFALLMSSFTTWSADTREHFSGFSKDFFDAACIEMPSRLMELAPHELNCCLAAFLSLGFVEYKFFTGVGRSALARHKTFGPVQLSVLLTILSEMRLVHVDLFNASAQVIITRARELRPVDILRVLRAFAKCSMPSDLLCQVVGDEVVSRCNKDKTSNGGFRVEDLCEMSWMLCVLQSYHENLFRFMFRLLEESPRVSADALCQLYECHLVLDSEHKKDYGKYRMEADTIHALLEHYKENRKDGRRCLERHRNDVTSVLKSLVEGIVHSNHRTSTGLLVDVAALRKRTSTDGYIHIDIDSALTVVRPLDQDDPAHASLVLDGSVAIRRRILQKHDLRLVTVREADWRALGDSKEKRRHLRALLASLGDVLE